MYQKDRRPQAVRAVIEEVLPPFLLERQEQCRPGALPPAIIFIPFGDKSNSFL
jgi:hypothetical protein